MAYQPELLPGITHPNPQLTTALTELNANVQRSQLRSEKQAKGTKRKSGELETFNPDDVELPPGAKYEWNADVVRNKIHAYVNSGAMKVGDLQDAMGVSSASFNRFLGLHGSEKGMGSDTFTQATIFFKKLEQAGLSIPKKKKTKKNNDSSKDSSKSSSKSKKKEDEEKYDVSSIHLDGEETDSVPIYDTCADVRTKVKRHLRETAATNASFVREISKSYANPPEQGLSTSVLKRFLGETGALGGSHTAIFYAAYVFFEKLRVKNNKPKTKKRQEMEEIWGKTPGGMETVRPNQSFICLPGEKPSFDTYGRISFGRSGFRV